MAKDKEVHLTADELSAILNGLGWFLTGGVGASHAKEAPLPVANTFVTTLNEMSIITQDRLEIKLAPATNFIIVQTEPHIIHVKRIFPQPQTAKGGGAEVMMPALVIWLKFANPTIRDQEVRAAVAREAEKERKAQAEHQQFLDKLGAVGKTVHDIRVTEDKEVAWIVFTDGSELRIYGGSLNVYGMSAEEVQIEKEQKE